eukprot:CAMPEP_0177634928 /NCGR_PEP_ID=MMETSP0447-20121125/3629_1 /TAXON_ID=0 /ORGANISM="Stygamoeba regulata, Strain BSH-02190019" /LENGTH=183 /DNA_ID=CAMNT_0019136681 /DNA_START=311 /DNA_END=862 /DNA_ORIENTATION=+
MPAQNLGCAAGTVPHPDGLVGGRGADAAVPRVQRHDSVLVSNQHARDIARVQIPLKNLAVARPSNQAARPIEMHTVHRLGVASEAMEDVPGGELETKHIVLAFGGCDQQLLLRGQAADGARHLDCVQAIGRAQVKNSHGLVIRASEDPIGLGVKVQALYAARVPRKHARHLASVHVPHAAHAV